MFPQNQGFTSSAYQQIDEDEDYDGDSTSQSHVNSIFFSNKTKKLG